MSITVLKSVDKDYKGFRERLVKYYRFELGWSRTMARWEEEKMGHRVRQLKALKLWPGEVNDIINILRCLDKQFPLEGGDISYGNKTPVETAKIIYEVYGENFRWYMKKVFKIGSEEQEIRHNEEQALAEQIARGFIDKEDIDINHSLPYIRSNINKNLVYPAQFDINKTYEVFPLIGVSGFTGIQVPRKYK